MKNMMKLGTGFSIAALAGAAIVMQTARPASAQYNDRNYGQDSRYGDRDNGQNYDPPARAGRIGYVEGSVSFQPGGEGDWLDAVPNRPLTVGDNLWVDRNSRAEIQLGSTSIRLGPETSISFLDMGNDVIQVRLSVGSMVARVRRFDRDDVVEIDTPNLAFNVYQQGEYRLDVNQNGDQTTATIWRGSGEITGAGNSYRLMEGQRGIFSGVDQLAYDVEDMGSRDAFDGWVQARDERQDRIRSSRYISTDMTGYEDLDDYGQWRNEPGYGDVWIPGGVGADWAPYRNGHWVYVSPWGWTWVEDEPWGFAPFHYGRWAYVRSSWCWVPGPLEVRPVYAPALVAFVGGGGFSIGVGIGGGGGVGWFPLGPGEVYVPWYRTSPQYVQNVNISNTRVNVTQVTNVYNNVSVNHVNNVTYVNQRVNNSVTVVNHDTFVNARPVRNNIVRVDQRQIERAPVNHEVVRDFKPDRQSVIGNARTVQVRAPQQAINRQVVATRQPVTVNRPQQEVQGMQRATPPPVRTVRAAPAGQAETLQRGAKGQSRPMPANEASPRGGQPGNQPGANNGRPGAPDNNRPGADNNRSVPRPGNPNNNRENGPQAGAPDNNRPDNRNNAPRPGFPDNRPGADNNRNANPRPDNNRNAVPRPGAPDNRPMPDNNRTNVQRPGAPVNNRDMNPPDNRPARPDNNRSEQQVQRPANAQPEQPRQYPATRQDNRPDNRPEQAPTRTEQPSRPPDTKQAPRNDNRPETRSEPAPRPQTRPVEPPPQREARPAEQRNDRPNPPSDSRRNNKDNKDNQDNKDNNPPRR